MIKRLLVEYINDYIDYNYAEQISHYAAELPAAFNL